MKTRLLTLVAPLLLLSLLFIPQTALAKTAVPQRPALNCGNCEADQIWFGGNTGALVHVLVPTFTATGQAKLDRYMLLQDSGDSTQAIIGVEYNDDLCGNGVSTTGQFFYALLDTSNGVCNYTNTYAFHTGDTGHTASFAVNNNGNGVDIWINNTGSGTEPCNPCHLANVTNSFDNIHLLELVSNNWTGTLQGKFHWTLSQYHNSTGWHYQTNDGTGGGGGPVPGNPPQMLWGTKPAVGNNGGDLFTCEKDLGTTC